MSILSRLARVLVIASVLAACDSENVSWIFVSNPGGGSGGTGGGAVIVIRTGSSTSAVTSSARWIQVPGLDDRGALTVHLAVGGEHALLERARELEVRSPLLPEARATLAGALAEFPQAGPTALRIRALEVDAIDDRASGPGTLHFAAAGSLLLVEHAAGVLAFGEVPPRYFPAGSAVLEIGDGLFVRTPDSRTERVLARPAPGAEDRLRRPAAGRIELLGLGREVIARLPEERVVLHGGAMGLFLTATFPDGLDSRTPTSLTGAEGNRYLLRVDER
jgi:hypothetical protein